MSIPDLTDKIARLDDQCCAGGGFGDVFQCRYRSNKGVQEVAVKAFRFNFSVDENTHDEGKMTRMIRRELGIWRRLRHPNIVPFLGIAYGFGRKGSASLVSMWMPHGTLHSFLEAHNDQLVVAHRLQLLLDIGNGLHYLHSLSIIHGDLTSNNVLLDHNYNACLTDFGCASLLGEIPSGLTYLKMSTVRLGTLRWAAPEHFSLDEKEMKHTIKSDIYSFGNIALLVLSGKYPWSEIRADVAVVLRLSQGHRPCRPLERPIDDDHWAFIERCWSSIPDRPLSKDVVSSLEQLLRATKMQGTIGLAAVMGQNSFIGGGNVDNIHPHILATAPTGSPAREHGKVAEVADGEALVAPSKPVYSEMSAQNGFTKHVAIVGETGVGKSTLVNVLTGSNRATVNNDIEPCTRQADRYHVEMDGVTYTLWDTRGLNEGLDQAAAGPLTRSLRLLGTAPEADNELRNFLRGKKPRINLIVFCIDADKIRVDTQWKNYDKIYVEFCRRKTRVAVVVTRMDSNTRKTDWKGTCEGMARALVGESLDARLIEAVPILRRAEDTADCKSRILRLISNFS